MTQNKTIVDCATGEQITVPLTAEELEMLEQQKLVWAKEDADAKAEAEAKELAKNSAVAKLSALGLTEEEVKALLG